MLEFLNRAFGCLCGQNPAHTWAPGGVSLPFCERCTGLYVGAVIAVLLHLCFRPKLTGRFLELHGAFLLLMLPLGFHWLPQGPVLRTGSGLLFAAGIVTFLRPRFDHLAPSNRVLPTQSCDAGKTGAGGYLIGLGAALALLPVAARWGGTLTGSGLALLGFASAVLLGALVLATLAGLATDAVHGVCRRLRPLPRP